MLRIPAWFGSRVRRAYGRQKTHRMLRKSFRFEALEDRCLMAFGADGIVVTDVLPTGDDRIASLAVQPDGKIVAAGPGGLARYNADGSLDGSFNGSGTIALPFVLSDLALQADGKIVVGGQQNGDFMLRRYNANGSLDSTFSGDGIATTDFKNGSRDEVTAIALAPPDSSGQQKIIAVGFYDTGWAASEQWTVLRYNANGTLDNSFDGDGKLTTSFSKGKSKAIANSVVVQPDGKILVVGDAVAGNGFFDFALARYNPNGTPDASFGASGKVTTDFYARSDQAFAVALQPDGKIVVAGKADSLSASNQFAIARYNANGTLDASFDGDGKVALLEPAFGIFGKFTGLSIQADGRIVAAGGYWYTVVARFTVSGSVDTSFDGDGWRVFELGPEANVHNRGLAMQSDGKILVGGAAGSSTGENFALARLNPDGSMDAAPTIDQVLFARAVDQLFADQDTAIFPKRKSWR